MSPKPAGRAGIRSAGQRELAAAGIDDPVLRRSYQACRKLNAAHGRTYFLATWLLPEWKRPYVHALYGFARYTDEIVDDLDSTLSDGQKATLLRTWSDSFLAQASGAAPAEPGALGRDVPAAAAGNACRAATGEACGDDVLPAVLDTIARWDIPLVHFEAFLRSMAMDLTVTGYETFDDLMGYVHGSAAAIGLQMVPILEPTSRAAIPYAYDLGVAFQLGNFIRDVGEDLRRGRVYLPADSLRAFGLTREDLASGVVDGRVRRLLAFEIARARELFRSAEPGIRLLHPTSRDCIRTAFVLYGGILDAVERADYQVLDRRVAVSTARRLTVAVPGLARARRARATAGR
ncbi:MAG: phytoene/squalene synthase family protein [Frankia sp.]